MEKSGILAIDVGTAAVKVFTGTVVSDKSVSIHSHGIVSAEGWAKGCINDMNALAQSIRQAVDCALVHSDIMARRAYIGIGGMGITSFMGTGSIALAPLVAIASDDIDRVCRAAVVATVPEEYEVLHVLTNAFRLDDLIVKGAPIGLNGTKLEAECQLVCIPKPTVNELVDKVGILGIEVAGVVANAVVGSHFATLCGDILSCVFLDIGAGNTDIFVYDQGKVLCVASIPLGGNYITQDIMQALEVEYNHAEAIKRYYAKLDQGLYGKNIVLDCSDDQNTDKNVPYDFLFNVIESRVTEITGLIYQYLQPVLSEMKLKKVLCTGGCASIPSMYSELEKLLNVPVEIAIPENLPAEYSQPVNTACYGVLSYAARQELKTSAVESTDQSSFWIRIKRFLHA